MLSGDAGTFLAGIGGLLVGLVAVVSLIISSRAKRDAAEARRSSPNAMLEGLRTEVRAVVEAHEESVRRHAKERDGMERALKHERDRADGCQIIALALQAAMTELRIDLAEAHVEVADLRRRFEASIAKGVS